MRILLFTISFFSSYLFYAQEKFSSFYFKTSQPTNTPSIFSFSENYTGSYYKENDSLIRIIVEKDSIYSEFGILFTLPKKKLKKNKTFFIEDSLLYGVQANSGIPFKSINDTIYAVMIQQDLLFKPDSIHILKQQNEMYFLNSKSSKNLFSTKLLLLKNDTLIIKEIDHINSFKLLKKFQEFDEDDQNNIKTYIANPTKKELELFINEDGFNELLKFHL